MKRKLTAGILLLSLLLSLIGGCSQLNSQKPAQSGSNQPGTAIQNEAEQSDTLSSSSGALQTAAEQPAATEVSIPVYALPDDIKADEIPLVFSPDNKTLYLMQRCGNLSPQRSNIPGKPLKGENLVSVDLVKLDVSTMKREVIAKGIPFVSYAKWNSDGTKIAFCGGYRLTVYDTREDRLLMTDLLTNDSVSYFGWSPDGNTIYTEHPNLVNGSIIALADSKLTHRYETDLNLYYKGSLNESRDYGQSNAKDGLYFATLTWQVDEKEQKAKGGAIPAEGTVLVDAGGNVQKQFTDGRFRGSYGKTLLQVGTENYGLTLFTDIAFPEKSVRLTEEYVYNAGFLSDGSAFFITSTRNVEKNQFILHVTEANGYEKAQIPVSGSAIALSPDGKSVFVSSPEGEIVDLPLGIVKVTNKGASHDEEANSGIYSAIRGAMDVYYKSDITGSNDPLEAEKYFIDSEDPEQWALFDMTTLFKERKYSSRSSIYNLNLTLERLDVNDDRASAKVYGSCSNSFGSAMGVGESLELIKKDGRWYVTGLSTFPGSRQFRDVKGKMNGIIEDLRAGRLFKGMLKDRDIRLGQIQFWQMSEPHYAENIDYANYCKVYLKVMEDKDEVTYKLILDKKNYRTWTPIKLDKEYLSGL